MASSIDAGLVLRLEATTALLQQQLRTATNEVETYAAKSTRAITVSSGQQQNAVKNLGFQFNDFLVQVQGGTPVLRAFAQQSGQAAGALSDMGGAAGAVGRFFSGILGGSILSVGTILAGYLLTMKDTNEALELAKVGSNGLSDAQSALGEVFDLTSGKIKSQNALLVANARLTAVNLRAEAQAARERTGSTLDGAQRPGFLNLLGAFATGGIGGMQGLNDRDYAMFTRLNDVRLAGTEAEKRRATQRAFSFSESSNFEGLVLTKDQFRQTVIDILAAASKESTANLIDQSLDSGKLAGAFFKPDRKKGRKASEADTFARSIGFADNNAMEAWLASGRQALGDADRARNPFPAVQGGSSKFEKNIGETLAKATQELRNLSVEFQDARTPMMKFFEELRTEGDRVNDALSSIEVNGLSKVQDGLADAVTGAKSLGAAFTNVANSIIADLVRIALRQAIIKPLAGLLGGGGGGLLSGLLGFADGGDPPVGRAFLVGERGPELMMTKAPTTVIPNHRLNMMGGGGMTINVDARGASDPAAIRREVERGLMAAAPSLIAAAETRTKVGLSRPRLPSALG